MAGSFECDGEPAGSSSAELVNFYKCNRTSDVKTQIGHVLIDKRCFRVRYEHPEKLELKGALCSSSMVIMLICQAEILIPQRRSQKLFGVGKEMVARHKCDRNTNKHSPVFIV